MASKLKDFDKEQETWQRFVQRVQLHFISAGIPDDAANTAKRRAILLQGMGIELFNKFCDSAGGNIDAMTFAQIVTGVETLVNPAPLEIYERYRFHNRMQQPGETATDYMVALRKIGLSCNFMADGANNADPTSARLRDQFVCGLENKAMQQYLLQQARLTIDNCVNLAKSFESAEATSVLLKRGASDLRLEVNAVKGKSKGKSGHKEGKGGKCFRCGRSNHSADNCRHKDAKCYKCGEKGHISAVCEKEETDSEPEEKIKGKGGKSIGWIGHGDDSGSEDSFVLQ